MSCVLAGNVDTTRVVEAGSTEVSVTYDTVVKINVAVSCGSVLV